MMLVFDLCAGLLLGLKNRRDVDRAELLHLAPFVALGMMLGDHGAGRSAERARCSAPLGVFAVDAAWSLLSRAAAGSSARWARPAGMVGGVFTALYGSGGPIYTGLPRAPARRRERLRASIAVLIFCTRVGAAGALLRHRTCSSSGVAAAAGRCCFCRAPVVGYFDRQPSATAASRRSRRPRDLGAAARRAASSLARSARRHSVGLEFQSERARDQPASAMRGLGREARIGIDDDRRGRPRTAAAGR